MVVFLFSEKECLVVGKDENIEQRVVEYSFCVCVISREVTFLCRPLIFGQNLTTHETPSFLAKMFLCVRALFEVSAFSANELQRRREKKLFVSYFSRIKNTPTKESFLRDTKPFFMRRETTTTMRDNSQQRNRRRNEQLWRIFAILYLFVPCGCCTTSAVLSALFLFVFFSPSSSFLHLCLVLLALFAPPVVLKTDFFSGKRIWRRKAERRGS